MEICVKRIHVNQGVGVPKLYEHRGSYGNSNTFSQKVKVHKVRFLCTKEDSKKLSVALNPERLLRARLQYMTVLAHT